MNQISETELSARLRALREPPPDTGFELAFRNRLEAEVESSKVVSIFRRSGKRRFAVMLLAAAIPVTAWAAASTWFPGWWNNDETRLMAPSEVEAPKADSTISQPEESPKADPSMSEPEDPAPAQSSTPHVDEGEGTRAVPAKPKSGSAGIVDSNKPREAKAAPPEQQSAAESGAPERVKISTSAGGESSSGKHETDPHRVRSAASESGARGRSPADSPEGSRGQQSGGSSEEHGRRERERHERRGEGKRDLPSRGR